MLMQSYPGGIESGTDWYQNDAGVVLTETTIRQTPFNAQGTPVAFRARMAIQYGGNIDEVVQQLGTRNNGLYTNEWLIGDAKNNEIAMYELGTNHTKLWRSSKNEWFGGTPGFYWGDNNAKDLDVRLEYLARSARARPTIFRTCPAMRDLAWQDLYRKYRGPDRRAVRVPGVPHRAAGEREHHGRQGRHRRTWPSRLMVWARDRQAQPARMGCPAAVGYAKNDGLYPSGYYLFRAEPSEALRAAIRRTRRRAWPKPKPEAEPRRRRHRYEGPPVEGLGAAGVRCRHLVRGAARRRTTGVLAVGRCGEGDGGAARAGTAA